MDISLLSTINTNYRVPLEVLISSLLLNKHASTAIKWHICTDEMDGNWDSWKNEIERRHCHQDLTIIFHRLQEISGRVLPVRGRARPIMYARLFVPEILPMAGRALYLDADMLVLRPIEELWAVDLGSHPCACCQDLAIPTVSSIMAIRNHRKLKRSPDDPYFNAGAMLIDIPGWKEKAVTERALEYIALYKESVNLFDQEALNAALGNDWLRLSYRWNIIASIAGRSFLRTRMPACDDYETSLLDPCIIHYAGTLKPWLNPFLQGRWFELYRAALKQSLPNFRFHPGLKHLAQAVYDATIRRWVYPLEQTLWEKRKRF
jgi:lipopolysaccharide biosynthesis glycosyltransferase